MPQDSCKSLGINGTAQVSLHVHVYLFCQKCFKKEQAGLFKTQETGKQIVGPYSKKKYLLVKQKIQ